MLVLIVLLLLLLLHLENPRKPASLHHVLVLSMQPLCRTATSATRQLIFRGLL